MAWIESHQELRDHPKTRRLARMLGINLPQAIGHLHMLWWWAIDYAPDGDLSAYDAHDIAEAAGWDGDAEAFVRALIECGPGEAYGFIERREDGRLVLHDWDDYNNEYKLKRAAAERKRRSRERRRQQGDPADVTGQERDTGESGTGVSRDGHTDVTGQSRDMDVTVTPESRDGHADVTPDKTRQDKDKTKQQPTKAAIQDGDDSRTAGGSAATARPPGSFVAAEIAAEVENLRASIPREVLDALIAATGRDITTLEEAAVVHEMLDLAPADLVAETIREVAERERRAGRPKPRSFRYFLGAVKDAAERARRAEEVDYALPDPNADYEVERRKRAAEFAAVTPWLRGEAG